MFHLELLYCSDLPQLKDEKESGPNCFNKINQKMKILAKYYMG